MDKSEALREIRAEYDRLDVLTGVDTKVVALRISTRMTRKLGCFSVEKKNVFARPKLGIAISSKILDRPELFTEVIRHEYAHAVVYLRHPRERHAHDAAWKAVCRQIGCTPRATLKTQ